jgi:hypothetical protein
MFVVVLARRIDNAIAYRGGYAECQGYISLRQEAGDSKTYTIVHYSEV